MKKKIWGGGRGPKKTYIGGESPKNGGLGNFPNLRGGLAKKRGGGVYKEGIAHYGAVLR